MLLAIRYWIKKYLISKILGSVKEDFIKGINIDVDVIGKWIVVVCEMIMRN